MEKLEWVNIGTIGAYSFTCGFCGNLVGPDRGFYAKRSPIRIYVCSYCSRPSFIDPSTGEQVPGVMFGQAVSNVPEDVETLYDEARRCFSVSAYTSSVLACRKLLMNIAVAQGADSGRSFIEYVEWLSGEGYVPPNGRGWVDHIRQRGNEATHEIDLKTREDAEELISFVEMLLKFIYEFPARVPQATT